MKLNSKRNNWKVILIVIAAVLVVAAIVGVVIGILINKEEEAQREEEKNTVNKIIVSSMPDVEYYVGEEANWSGLQIQAVTTSMDTTYFINYPSHELTITGFDSETAGEKVITVQYQEFTTTFVVTVKEYSAPKPTLVSIEVCDLISTYTVERWNKNGANLYGAYLKLTYSDGSTKGSYEETPLLWDYIETLSKVDGAGTTQMVINYIEGGITVSTTVTITITE